MGIGAQSSFWRRQAFRAIGRTYFRRKIKTVDGIFEAYVSPGSSLKVLSPRGVSVDPVHARFIRDWVDADAIVWDVGSNLGLFAIPAALKAVRGRVYGFEPDVDLAAQLVRSLRLPLNKNLNVAYFCLALSNADGAASFQISRFSRAMNRLESVGEWNDDKVVADDVRLVPTMRIDTLAQSVAPPSALKIDVEGAEMLVLKGGEATIAKFRPVILIEGPHELWEPMGTFFRQHDYLLLDGAAKDQSALKDPVWDTVAVPKEKFSKR